MPAPRSTRRGSGADGVGDPLAHDPGRPAGWHRDPVQHVTGFHRALLVRDDDELRLVAELVDEVEEAVQVDVVERGFDLVEEIEGRRAGAEHREQVRERGEGPLTAGEQRESPDVLARWASFDLDPGVE